MGTWHNFKISKHGTHGSLYVPVLRMMLARDLWVLRKIRRNGGDMKGDWAQGIRLGLETAFRRIQDDTLSIPVLAGRDEFIIERKYFPSREERLAQLAEREA
jgi:hypothetical protein